MSGTATPAPRGLDGVVAASTRLSHVDGLAGRLIIGGYELQELAGRVSFDEAASLLWRDHLPDADELAMLRQEMGILRHVPSQTLSVVRAAVRARPIDALRMACATLSLDLPNADDISPPADLAAAKMLTARFPTIIAAHARMSIGEPPIPPREDLSLAANFLYMVHGREPDPIAARALDTYWTTVIDHGMNASTFAGRVIASTRSDMVSAVTGAIGALKGPLHGGAPGPVLDMLVEIGEAGKAEAWVRRELAEGRRIMGFGHRVYKVRDPRADVLAKVAEQMSGAILHDRQLFELARAVEQTTLRVLEEAKPGRNLRTNVEFYTALVLQSLGLHPASFVALFACGRVAGWCAHVIEQHAEDHLIRPQSEYIGPKGLKVAR
ncbi:MAG: citrate synthase/methylcitrate synthase [Candidatus Eisenbacteria bacterium]|uniref:Citrate synthase n=1 Tax=Eiseniibacteriota bacterium TaxID=2212470 RepID=A0A538UEI8_UNCEI|nr:MAG: citrate synthase/methylcitrate synthase [Candidatus Eisenbacteria bacterium]